MENAEEVMQLLEEFSKVKPKEIPRELEDYLGYVAKTGDPVFQWSLIKGLLREKLVNVITDFYESTLTTELPPCPNVEPFNYDRMKTSLLERFDTFTGAPFTIQRICELLINPRKEYNRADKYMRAIEKNILVVSTREPGTGKRPLECDQSETVLNGIPDVKLSESDGSLLHVPTELPYLGAPPASNDVTVETTEPNSTISERVGTSVNGDVNQSKICGEKSWPTEESQDILVSQDSEQVSSRLEPDSEEVPINVDEKSSETSNCDTNIRVSNVQNINSSSNLNNSQDDYSSEMITQNNETLPDSIDSSDSIKQCRPTETSSDLNIKAETNTSITGSDENEVSSSPADAPEDISIIQDIDEPTNSEAVATDACLAHDAEPEVPLLPDSDSNSSDKITEENEAKTITISEVRGSNSENLDLECSASSGTVVSPISPGNNSTQQSSDEGSQNIVQSIVEHCEQEDSHPDSSNDVCTETQLGLCEKSERTEISLDSEADSQSETNVDFSETPKLSDDLDGDAVLAEEIIVQEITDVSSLCTSKISEEECVEKSLEDQVISSDSPEETVVSESPCSTSSKEDNDNENKLGELQATGEIVEEMLDNERRDETVIQAIPNIISDGQEQITIEEISVDPSCDTEEEAMDVDDCSNQMMISEGENEGEPMDECDQTPS